MDFTPGKPLRAYAEDGQWRDFSTDELVGLKLNQYKSWKCGAGVQNLQVNMDGDIYGATCRVGGLLGNAYKNFQLPDGWIDCPRNFCACGADLFVPKVKSFDQQRLLRKTNLQKTEKEKKSIQLTEFSAMERVHSSHYKQVYWEIGRRCNFDCTYCPSHIHNKTDRHRTLEELKNATQQLLDKFSPGSLVNFIISGGEPTMNPDFMDWVKWIASQGHRLSMHSNGSRLSDYYRELIRYGDLNLSVHFQFANKEKMLKNIIAITDEKIRRGNREVGHLEVKLMMDPGRREEVIAFEQELKKIRYFKQVCTWAIVPIRDGDNMEHVMKGYEPEDFQLFGDRV